MLTDSLKQKHLAAMHNFYSIIKMEVMKKFKQESLVKKLMVIVFGTKGVSCLLNFVIAELLTDNSYCKTLINLGRAIQN